MLIRHKWRVASAELTSMQSLRVSAGMYCGPDGRFGCELFKSDGSSYLAAAASACNRLMPLTMLMATHGSCYNFHSCRITSARETTAWPYIPGLRGCVQSGSLNA